MTPIRRFIGDRWYVTSFATDGSPGVGYVKIKAGGTGFTSVPLITFDVAPVGGRRATGTAVVAAGAVTGVNIVDPGIYTPGVPPTAYFTGGGGRGAVAVPVVGNPIDLTGHTPKAELINQFAPDTPIDLTLPQNGVVSLTDAAHGEILVSVLSAVTQTLSDASIRNIALCTRIHVFFLDEDGGKNTIGVIPIQPTRV